MFLYNWFNAKRAAFINAAGGIEFYNAYTPACLYSAVNGDYVRI